MLYTGKNISIFSDVFTHENEKERKLFFSNLFENWYEVAACEFKYWENKLTKISAWRSKIKQQLFIHGWIITTAIRPTQFRETGVSRHHGGLSEGYLETPWTSQHYGIEGFKGGPSISRTADVFLPSLILLRGKDWKIRFF